MRTIRIIILCVAMSFKLSYSNEVINITKSQLDAKLNPQTREITKSSDGMNVVDQELLKLLVQTFIGSQDLENAFLVAKKGAQLFPKDPFWWKTLGQISAWIGKTDEAMSAYLNLYSLDKSDSVKKDLFNMALILNRFDIAKQLVEEEFKQGRYKDLADIYYIYYQAGDLRDFIQTLKGLYEKTQNDKVYIDSTYLLKTVYETKQDKVILAFLTRVLYESGNVSEAEHYGKILIQQYIPTVDEVLLYSNILYSNKKFKEAYDVLKEFLPLSLKDRENKTLVEYLYTLSDLGWSLKDFQTSVYASDVLFKMGKERLLDLIRLYTYHFQNRDYNSAAFYSKTGYEKLKSSILLEGYVESLFMMNRYKDVVEFVEKKNIDVKENRLVLYRYLSSLLRIDKTKRGESILLEALSKKFDPQLFEEAVYTAIETNNLNLVRKLLSEYKNYSKDLYIPFGLMYVFLQNGEKALESLQGLKYSQSPSELVLYADVLSLYGRNLESERIKFKIFKLLEDKNSLEQQEIEIYLRLAMDFLSNRKFMETLEKYKTSISIQSYNDIYTSYQLKLENQINVEFLVKKHGYKLRPWAYLNLALWADDRYLQKVLLEKYADILPIRDRVEAFRRTGEINKAMEYGFKGLDENREDYLLYKQQRDLIVQNRSKYQVEVSYTERVKVKETTQSLDISNYLARGLYLNLKYRYTDVLDSNGQVLINVPNKTDAGFEILKLTDDGNMKFGFGALKKLTSNYYMDISYQRYINDRFNLTLYAGLNINADDTLYLLYGGIKNRYSVGVAYNFNNRFAYFINPSLNYYYSSDKFSLGSSFNLYQQVYYKLRVGYPDYTFRLYTSHGIYKEKDGDKGKIKMLSPYQNIKVLPETFNQVGVGFSFGYENDTSFVRVWRPFLSVDLNYTDTVGFGYGFSGGFGGSLFRKDNMSFGLNYLKGIKGTSDSYLNLYLKYRHLY